MNIGINLIVEKYSRSTKLLWKSGRILKKKAAEETK